MKPLAYASLEDFLYRFEHFQNSELTAIDVITPTSIKIALSVQDRQRAFDWIGMNFLFEEVVEANLIDEKTLRLVDMDEGMSIIFENGLFYFMLGSYKTANGTKDALCYIIAKSLKYQEGEAKF